MISSTRSLHSWKHKEIKGEEIKSLPVTVHNSVTLFGYIIMKKTRILNVIIVHRKYFFPFFNLSVSILELSINFFFNSLFFTGKLISDKYNSNCEYYYTCYNVTNRQV